MRDRVPRFIFLTILSFLYKPGSHGTDMTFPTSCVQKSMSLTTLSEKCSFKTEAAYRSTLYRRSVEDRLVSVFKLHKMP